MAVSGLFADNAAERQSHNAEECLAEYTARHFGFASLAVDKNNRLLAYSETQPPSGIFHLYLEAVTDHPHRIEVDTLQHLATIADETRRSIAHGHTRNQPHVTRGEI